jgi:hypothetical protein
MFPAWWPAEDSTELIAQVGLARAEGRGLGSCSCLDHEENNCLSFLSLLPF